MPPRPVLPKPPPDLTGPPLPREFYAREVLDVARACIGKILVHRAPEGLLAGRIVESEAYRGPEDLAAHSSGGRRTARTEAMFGPAGHIYIYLLYGLHWALNLVAAEEGQPHAVLVRALEPLAGMDLMSQRRRVPPERVELTNGPGKVCQALGLDGRVYGADLCAGPLYLIDGPAGRIGRSARINVDYAGAWAERPWRFYERGNRYVSVRPRD